MRRDAIAEDEPELVGLIDAERGNGRERPSQPRGKASAHGRRGRSGAFISRIHGQSPAAFNSRNAVPPGGVTWGSSGSLPTSGEIFQERAHLRPFANLGTTATPGTPARRNAPG